MRGINIRNITRICGGTYYGPEHLWDQEIASIYTDSRKIEKDSLFIPIQGERVDGHCFISQVFEMGALVTLSERKLDGTNPYILIESSLQALKDIAEFYLEQLNIPVIGITGSVGKTSTKELIASVLSQKFHTLKTDGNFNNEIGLPLTVFRLREEHEAAVLEMGISDFGEMSRLTKIAKPNIAVITNIGLCHLENLKTRDGILKAKTEIFQGLKENGTIILNGDDDKLCTIEEYQGKKPVYFGFGHSNAIYADQIVKLGLKGSKCILHTPKGELAVQIPVPGAHMVMNAMAACAVGLSMSLTLEEIREGIENLQSVPGRMNLIHGETYSIIDDCYNANPVSMKSSVDVLMEAEGRKVCILGDMFELGQEERELHAEVGTYISSKVDLLITIGSLSEYISQAASAGAECRCVHFADKKTAMQAFPELLEKGDSILVKASHGMEFSEIVEYLQNIK